jgi:hypothetical protein
MSLTGQLCEGRLAEWCTANLTGMARLAAELTAAANDYRPIRPGRIDTPAHWATIGGALGQRLAFATQHASPYYTLLDAHRAGLADWATSQRCAAQYPTHAGLDPSLAARANQLRAYPTAAGSTSTTRPPPTMPADPPPAPAPSSCSASQPGSSAISPDPRHPARSTTGVPYPTA